jgi:hypothetical protein
MSVKFSETSYETFGKCLKIENDVCELYVTLDLGPRIIRYALKGKENMIRQDVDKNVDKCGPEFDETFYKGAYWCNYGGHRLWTSPESLPETYYPDNDPIKYEVKGTTAFIYGNPQIHNNVQYTIEITLADDSADVTLRHTIKNIDKKPQTFAPWALSVMDAGGLEIIPKPTTDTGLLANCVLAIWPYARMDDERVFWGHKYITLKQDPNFKRAFKLGINNEHGWVAYHNKGCLFVKKYNHFKDATYPDFGVSFETYTNHQFLEIETLGVLGEVKPNDEVEHFEYWTLKEADVSFNYKNEIEVEEFVEKFVK